MSSIDKNANKGKEQQHTEGQGDKPKPKQSSGSSGSSSQVDRINAELAKPNLPEPARKALQEKKQKLEGK